MCHKCNMLQYLVMAGAMTLCMNGSGICAQETVAPVTAAPTGFTTPPDTPVIPWTRFSIQYAVRILGNDGPSKIVFYITNDGGATWRLLGEDPDKKSPMLVTVPGEGTYGFATVVVSGNRQPLAPRPGTRPDKFVIVDRTPPSVTWLSPVKDHVKATENGILLEWTAQDPHMGATPVSIEYSTDGGKLWLPVRQNLPAKGSINWQVPPAAGENLQLRIIAKDLAGNTRIARNQAHIAVDRTPPTVRITGPNSAGQRDFDVFYEAEDESGVASVELYYTYDHGNTWSFFNTFTASPIHFTNNTHGDAVGLYLAASDRKGNRTPAPQSGTQPMKVVALDQEKPQVTFQPPFNATGTVIEAKKPVSIVWNTVEANPEDASGVIEYSTDGGQTWFFIADKQPVNGSYQWTPQVIEKNILLRITVSDKFGNKGAALSQTFGVDSGRPGTQIAAVKPVPGGNPAALPPVATDLGNDLTVPSIPLAADVMGSNDDKIGAIDEHALDALPTPGNLPPAKDKQARQTPPPAPSVATPVAPAAGDMQIPMPAETGIGKAEKENKAAKLEDIPMPATTSKTAAAAKKDTPAEASQAAKKDEKDPFADFGNIPPIGGDLSTPPAPAPVPASAANDGLKTIDAAATKPQSAAPNTKAKAPQTADKDSGLSLPDIPSPKGSQEESKTTTPSPAPAAPAPAFDAAATLAKANAALATPQGSGIAEAEKLAQEIITQDPNNPAPYAIMAQVRIKQGKFGEAVNFINNACRLAPGDFNYLEILGYAEYTRANGLYSVLRSGKVAPGKQQAVSADMVKALNSSETTYLQILKSPDKEKVKNAHFRLGHIDYFRGTKVLTDDAQWTDSIRKAIVNYQKAGEINEPAYREILQIGICNYRLRDYDQAERWLERAIEVAQNDRVSPKEAYYYLASIHEKLDRPQQALEYWQKVAKEYPAGNQFQKIASERINEMKNLRK